MFCGVLKYVYEMQLLYVFNINYQNTVFFVKKQKKKKTMKKVDSADTRYT